LDTAQVYRQAMVGVNIFIRRLTLILTHKFMYIVKITQRKTCIPMQ